MAAVSSAGSGLRGVITFGIPALDDVLEASQVEFPIRADTLIRQLGDPYIPFDSAGRSISLSDAIDRAGRVQFESRRDLLNALHPVFEETRAGGGLRGWLRRLFAT